VKGLTEHYVPIHESSIVIFNKFTATTRGVSSSLNCNESQIHQSEVMGLTLTFVQRNIDLSF
jgi:hypothetical protein